VEPGNLCSSLLHNRLVRPGGWLGLAARHVRDARGISGIDLPSGVSMIAAG
jgi:hypothetical protein